MSRAYYAESIGAFLAAETDAILGMLSRGGTFAIESTQRDAWLGQITILQTALAGTNGRGSIYFEYAVPRLGKRIDVLLLLDHVVFVLEFKVGEREFLSSAKDQVWDYAVDLKNFHETTHSKAVAPILIATKAQEQSIAVVTSARDDGVLQPIFASANQLRFVFDHVLQFCNGAPIDTAVWETGGYHPTPTIVEAAMALYNGHGVADISRNDATAINLTRTTSAISEVILAAQQNSHKAICLVTGVPGAGKTLVGLKIATEHTDTSNALHSVFLSGNGPLVAILQEALARDKVRREAEAGRKLK